MEDEVMRTIFTSQSHRPGWFVCNFLQEILAFGGSKGYTRSLQCDKLEENNKGGTMTP